MLRTMPTTQTVSPVSTDRSSERQPIFSALEVLGLRYAEIGRLAGVSTKSVHMWATGKEPIPLIRHLALQFLVTRLTGLVGAKYPPNTRYARRSQIAIDAANAWAKLSRDEMDEDTGGVYQAEDLERGIALGQRMLARLEEQ
jgi:hypothetical protein